MVMEYVPETLQRVIRHFARRREPLPEVLAKYYSFQLLRAIAYLSDRQICHRDLKPSNILVDPATHTLKLCDFGTAKQLLPGEESLSYVSTRCYRSPEQVFGYTRYTCQIDVWAAGCIIAEMVLGRPLFAASCSLDHLV
jgi:serine/threonine protein kinase